MTMAQHGQGHALIMLGDIPGGMTLFDEAMVAVVADEASPIVAGSVYCGVIEACQGTFDLRRAQEWTAALSRWCDSQPQVVPYRGQCLVHRSEIMRMRGSWGEALEEARRACERLSDPPGQPALGMVFYQLGELHRLRGDIEDAEEAYLKASQLGRRAQPGLSQLRLAQGRIDAAAAAIRLEVEEVPGQARRAKLLPAGVEIMLAVGDVPTARSMAEEVSGIATGLDAPLLDAVASHARGAVLLAEGEPSAALDTLRSAEKTWLLLEMPYEAARARTLIGAACRDLGDRDTARSAFDAAHSAFTRLGARLDVAFLEDLIEPTVPANVGGLSVRELEVLRQLAAGKSNREIAGALVISEHTVRRHLQNVFAKLGVSSRTAATAYAFQHHLV